MKTRIKIVFSILWMALLSHYQTGAQTPFVNFVKLSPKAQVSILEIDRANDQLYQAFGHIAIHVADSANYLDRVYSYGAFDFNTESFYWKFITGRLPYQLAVSNMEYTLLEYGPKYENRSVTQHRLNLSTAQKQRVFDLLEENYQPQKRTYQYKFFQDNCSTRIRDIFKKAMGDSLVFGQVSSNKMSYRGLMNSKLNDLSMPAFFMNMAIGLPSDHICNNEEAMYIPKILANAFKLGTNGGKPLTLSSNILYKDSRPLASGNTAFGFILGLSIILLFSLLKKWPKMQELLLKVLFFSVGIIGLLIIFLWFFTSHGVTSNNLNILWAWPSHVWAVFALKGKVLKKYFTVWLASVLVFTVLAVLLKWQFGLSGMYLFVACISIIVIRYFNIFNKTQNS